MSDKLSELITIRKNKLNKLIEKGIDPYPSEVRRSFTNKDALERFDNLLEQEVALVGRIRSLRNMGKIVFGQIEDPTARIQFLLKQENLADFDFFVDVLDQGDFLEVTGKLFLTKTGEKTIEAKNVRVLSKSLRPLPSDHFGIEDTETKLRKRYLDILLDPETKQIFVKKAAFWNSMRDFMHSKGFLHMDMPVLESTPGGAEAKPFITHHNALDKDFYLRISLELPLKKMLVAGYEKVFEIGRIFRNEGISTEHLQDYTQMEFYWAYSDFNQLMEFVQEMYQYILMQTFGTLQITSKGQTVDWSGTWERVSYIELFKEKTDIDLLTCTDDELREYCNKHNIAFESFAERGRLIDLVFKTIRKSLDQTRPVFLIDQPIELEPLAKKVPGNAKIVQRMQIIAYGTELGKGFGELNDPLDQRSRFEAQEKLRKLGDDEAQMLDEDYVEAMEYGMPPCSGFGISERNFSIWLDRSIRETVVFPLMHDKDDGKKKDKETPMAVAVVNKGAGLLPWQEMNTVAHLSAAFAAREGKHLFYADKAETKDGQEIKMNISHAIMIKAASAAAELAELIDAGRGKGLQVAEFTREMIETSDDKKVIVQTKEQNKNDIIYYGALIFGPKKIVSELTKDFPLYS